VTGASALGQDGEPPEPREVVTLGRACAHNDGVGRLNGELTFRYPDNEVVVIPSAGLEASDRFLLKIEWHVRDQSPVRGLKSHLESQLELERPPDVRPEVQTREYNFGEGLPPRSVYDEVDAFETVIQLSPTRPLCVAHLTLKSVAEATLDRATLGPETRKTFFVRQMRVSSPEQAVPLSRILTSFYREYRELSRFLDSYASYLSMVGLANSGQPVDEAPLVASLQRMLQTYAKEQFLPEKAGGIADVDWKAWDAFWKVGAAKKVSASTDPRPAATIAFASEAGKVIARGLENKLPANALVDVLCRLEGQYPLRRLTREALDLSNQCSLQLLKMLGAENRANLQRSAEEYLLTHSGFSAVLHQLHTSLTRVIGLREAASSTGSAAPETPDPTLLPALSTPVADLVGTHLSEEEKSHCVESIRARLLPLWMYLGTRGLAGLMISNERAFGSLTQPVRANDVPQAASTADEPPTGELPSAAPPARTAGVEKIAPAPTLSLTMPTAGVSTPPDGARPGPTLSVDRGTHTRPASPKPGSVRTRQTEGVSPTVRDTHSAIRDVPKSGQVVWGFSDGLGGWEAWEQSDRHPGIHRVAVRQEPDGRVLELHREGSGLTLSEGGVRRRVNAEGIHIGQPEEVALVIEFRILRQSLPGRPGTNMSYPLRVQLDYVDETEAERHWAFGFLVSGSSPNPSEGLKVPQDQWLRWESLALRELLPGLKELTTIRLSASGWDFTSLVKSVGFVDAR